MLRIAVPYGLLSTTQIRKLAHIARTHDKGYAHVTTRQNFQFNWPELKVVPEILAELATVQMHAIQTSGACIRNITSDPFAGVAGDEYIDPRPWCEVLRQWSTFHPEFAFLPRKFKIAVNGAEEDRAVIQCHDIGLELKRDAAGEIGFRVLVGGGMGRTPIIGEEIADFVPWQHIITYCEAILRVYNRYGRRDNLYKARIKILVKAEGQSFIDAVEKEYRAIVEQDGAPHTITAAELARVQASFVVPPLQPSGRTHSVNTSGQLYQRWLQQNVRGHKLAGMKAVTLSFKRVGFAPGDASADTLDALAQLAEQFSAGEARITHDQNLMLPWVFESDLPALYEAARALGLAQPNIGLLTDMIACPGGDFCSLANARSLPIAAAITERYQDLDELDDLGEIDAKPVLRTRVEWLVGMAALHGRCAARLRGISNAAVVA